MKMEKIELMDKKDTNEWNMKGYEKENIKILNY